MQRIITEQQSNQINNNVYVNNKVSQIYPSELQLNKVYTSDTEAAFLDLHLSISNDIVSATINDKRHNFDFEIVNFPFLDGDVPRSTSYGAYISQLICFASHISLQPIISKTPRKWFWWHILLMLGIHARITLCGMTKCPRVDATSETSN